MDERTVAPLLAAHDMLYDAQLVDDAPRLPKEAVTAKAVVVRHRPQHRGELRAALTRCKVVGRRGAGLDNIDVPGCEPRGMRVTPATGAKALSVAEYGAATAMMLLRGADPSTAATADGKWPRNALSSGREIAGKTLGLIGFGSIGQLTARGGGVDELALAASLNAGHLHSAAIDVFDAAPLPAARHFKAAATCS